MNTNTPSAPSTLTLAKTGTVHGRPALVAYEGKQTILLVLPAEEGSDWSEIDRSPHSGIRGLGQMMKKLDKDSARNPSDQPAWIKGAQVEPAGSVLASAVASAAPGIVAVLRADEVPAVESVPAAVEPVGEQAPVVEVAASPLAGFLAADVIAEVATTTDLAFLRAAREDAARAGAGPEVLRVISMRAGEVVLGFDPTALRKVPKPATTQKAPTMKAPPKLPDGQTTRTRQKHIGIREMITSHIVNVGDKVHLRSNPELTTTIADNGNSADGGSLCAWTKRVTGWSAVDIYSNLIHSQSGKLLRELR